MNQFFLCQREKESGPEEGKGIAVGEEPRAKGKGKAEKGKSKESLAPGV